MVPFFGKVTKQLEQERGGGMPRAPSEKVKEAEKLYHKGGMSMADIAKKLGIPVGTVRRWKHDYNWDAPSEKKKSERSVKKGRTEANVRKKGGQKGNKNGIGNSGGAPERNRNAEKHGFFSKYMPEESLGILDEIADKDYVDILWENIQISYAAILRSQRIMFVKNKDELKKEIKKIKKKEGETEVEWEFQFAWDRQATFLSAQARAMSELRALIKQYEELASGEQLARVAKIKAETERIKNAGSDDSDTAYDWVVSMTEEEPEQEGGGVP